jgi:hypothetical protein
MLWILAMVSGALAEANSSPERLLISPFGFLDTSGEPRDQRAEHTERLSSMTHELASGLEASGLYRIVEEGQCVIEQARAAGADLVLAGAVQKVSTMASSVWVGAFETATGKRVFYRQMTFRGDTDDAWHHATSFMVREIKDDPPRAH